MKTPDEPVVSFKAYLRSDLQSLTGTFAHETLTPRFLAEFVALQSSYQEEGVVLHPLVFLTNNLRKLLDAVNGRNAIPVGHGTIDLITIHQIFKRCAPLAADQTWAIFVEFADSEMRYGVFRTEQSPLEPTAFERLRDLNDEALSIIGLNRLGGSFVEVRNAQGECRYINMGADEERSEYPGDFVKAFTDAVTDTADDAVRKRLKTFYARLAFNFIHAPHGALVAIINDGFSLPSLFNDGISFESRLDVAAYVDAALDGSASSESWEALAGISGLIRAMMGMDGIVVLDTSGSLVGYNYFVKNKALPEIATSQVIGGARRRAFEALCTSLGSEIRAVFYKSRDGALNMKATHSHF